MKRYFVSNWRLLIGSSLGFIGAILIAVDRLPPVHRQVDRVQKWRDINHAVTDLSIFDHPTPGGKKVGYVVATDPGFADLTRIIKLNKPELKGKIVAIAQNAPATFGGVDFKIVHVALEGNPQGVPVTTDYIFHEWVAEYREGFFLKWGLTFVTLGFLFGIIGRIERRKVAPNKPSEATSQ